MDGWTIGYIGIYTQYIQRVYILLNDSCMHFNQGI